MAKPTPPPKYTTYTVSASGSIVNTGTATGANYAEINGSTGNTFVLQENTFSSSIKLIGNNNVYVEGNSADFQFSQKGKTVTMSDGEHKYSLNLSTMSSKVVVTTTIVFIDGSYSLSNNAKGTKVYIHGFNDDGDAKTQGLTGTLKDVTINTDSSNTAAVTFFSNETLAAEAVIAAEKDFAVDVELNKYAYDAAEKAQDDAIAADASSDVGIAAVTDIASARVAVALADIAADAADAFVAAAADEVAAAVLLTQAAALTGNAENIKGAQVATLAAQRNVDQAAALKADSDADVAAADQLLIDVTAQTAAEADFAVDVELNKYAYEVAEKAQDDAKAADANYDVAEAGVTDIASAQVAVSLAEIADEAADTFVAAAAQEQLAAELLTEAAALTGNAEDIKAAAIATYAAQQNADAAAAIKVDALEDVADAAQLLADVTAATAIAETEALNEEYAANALTAYNNAEAETNAVLEAAENLNLNYDYYAPAVTSHILAEQAKVFADGALATANEWVIHANAEQLAALALKDATDLTTDPTDDAAADAAVADAARDVDEAAYNLLYAQANEEEAIAALASYPVPPATLFTLTTGVDTFVGTDGDNYFDGSALDTLSPFDSLVGGSGDNSLLANLTSDGLAVGLNIQNIQTAVLQTTDSSFSADLSTWTGLTSATINVEGNGGGPHTSAITASLGTQLTVLAVDGIVDINGAGGELTVVTSTTSEDIFVGQDDTVISALTSVSITGGYDVFIDDSSLLGETLTEVTLNGNSGDGTINANALAILNLNGQSTGGQAVTVNGSSNRALTVNLNGVTGLVASRDSVTDNTASTLNLNAIIAPSYYLTATATAATTVNINALTLFSLDALTGGAATTAVNISGPGLVFIGSDTLATNAVITSTSTGGVSINQALLAGQQFAGSASSGNDIVTFAAGNTTANDVGEGNNTVYLDGSLSGGTIIAGSGYNELVLANAGTSLAGVSGFDELNLTSSFSGAIDASGFSLITDYASTATTLNNVDAGTDLLLSGSTAAVTYNLADYSGSSDALDLFIDGTSSPGANTVFASGIETVNLFVINNTYPTVPYAETLTLSTIPSGSILSSAQTINVFAGALTSVTLVDTLDTTITTVDASGMTGTSGLAGGGFTWTTGVLSGSSTITGSLLGGDIIDASAAGAAVSITETAGTNSITGSSTVGSHLTGGTGDDTILGGADADTIIGGTGTNIITGGLGADSITLAGTDTVTQASGDSVQNTAATVNSAGVATGDSLTFGNGVDVITGFSTASDSLNLVIGSAVTGNSVAQAATLNSVNYLLSGFWNAVTEKFTVDTSFGTDTLIVDVATDGDAFGATGQTNDIVLVGVSSVGIGAVNALAAAIV